MDESFVPLLHYSAQLLLQRLHLHGGLLAGGRGTVSRQKTGGLTIYKTFTFTQVISLTSKSIQKLIKSQWNVRISYSKSFNWRIFFGHLVLIT